MRKSIDGLATLVLSKFQLDPHQPALFLFCGRRKDRIKGLLWDETGFLLLYKRLENGQYQWPDTPEDLLEISEQQLRWLTEGLSISQPKAVQKVSPAYSF
jgi:transposase